MLDKKFVLIMNKSYYEESVRMSKMKSTSVDIK